MAGKPRVSGQVARKYCKRYAALPSLQIARLLRQNEPKLFSSVESARTAVRYCRGAHGDAHRKANVNRVPRLELPQPAEQKWKRHELPAHIARWLILADIHSPYFDRDALSAALAWGRAKPRCDGVLILGDLVDCYQLSSFERDPRERSFSEELITTGQILDVIQNELRPKSIVWKYGNHEYRHERFMFSRAPELLNVRRVRPKGNIETASDFELSSLFSFEEYLCTKERGIITVPNKHPIDHRALTILHGDEWQRGMSNSVNPARTAYLRGKECAIVAHSHVTSEHTEQSMRGVMVTCWSVGALCNLHPQWAPINKWNHGVARLTTGSEWSIDNRRIMDGKTI